MHGPPKLTLPLNRSRASQDHDLCKLCRAPLSDASCQVQNHSPSGSAGEEDCLKVFAIYRHGGHLGQGPFLYKLSFSLSTDAPHEV